MSVSDALRIALPGGYTTLVDGADWDLVAAYDWHPFRTRNTTYVRAGGGSRVVLLHRVLLDPPQDVEVDHHNGNGLDNRRPNLRLATHPQNCGNQRLSRANTSGYKGVYWDREREKWHAQIQVPGGRQFLGRFNDPWEAAQAYNAAAVEAWGEFARVNAYGLPAGESS